jgi:hypothetical protein
MRVIEAVLAAVILGVTMLAALRLTNSANPYASETRDQLTRYCYDFLISLADRESFDRILFYNSSLRAHWEQTMTVTLSSLLPANLLYNMTIFNMTSNNGIIGEQPLNNSTISNASSADFLSSKEVAAADMTYTTRKTWVLKIHLELARG